ncbi:hypothetical protein COO60DRAFT_179855 [Scenedesmus sp. NREL 46B-D3]|nr:hypothetical protein COO60DRAFT_179855 [Scenedesmus sp. NREL 46B-D3]
MPDCVSSASKPGTSSTCSDECCAAYYTACSMMQAKSHANSRAACHTACPLTKALQQAPAMLAMEKSATLRQQAHVLCIAVVQACYMQKEEHYKDTYIVCASTLSAKQKAQDMLQPHTRYLPPQATLLAVSTQGAQHNKRQQQMKQDTEQAPLCTIHTAAHAPSTQQPHSDAPAQHKHAHRGAISPPSQPHTHTRPTKLLLLMMRKHRRRACLDHTKDTPSHY